MYDDDFLSEMPEWEIDYPLEEGESIEGIAGAFETSVEEIAALNPDVNMTEQFAPGQNIRLRYRPRFCAGGTIYTVRRRETLADIAARFGTTEMALRQANPFLDGIRLRPGLAICIPPRPVRCPGGRTHVVAAGENIYDIASRYGISVAELLRANRGIDPNRLFRGQRLCIPSRAIPGGGFGRGECPRGFLYTVATGDTLYNIATQFGTTLEMILRANPGLDPDRVFIGQQICIPRMR